MQSGVCEKTPEADPVLEEEHSKRVQEEEVEELRIELSLGRMEGRRNDVFSLIIIFYPTLFTNNWQQIEFISPSQICFAYDTNGYVNSLAYHCIFSLCLDGGGHLMSSQEQSTTERRILSLFFRNPSFLHY